MSRLYIFVYSLLLSTLFLTIFFHPITSISDDLGRHILLGHIILQTQRVPASNLLSYTFTDFPFINTSWLSEVLFFICFRVGGFNLLLLLSVILSGCALSIQIFSSLKHNSALATLMTTFFYLLLLSFRSDIRPELFSMLFLSIFISILYATRQKPSKLLYLLIPLEMIWVNAHIYFFIGPLLVFLFLLDNLLRSNFHIKKISKVYFFTLLGTLLAAFANPAGIKGALYPFIVLQNYGLSVTENQSIFSLYHIYQQTNILFPLVVIGLLCVLAIIGWKRMKLIDWLLVGIFSFAAMIIFRNILLFVFTTFLIFATQLNYVIKTHASKLKAFFPPYACIFLHIFCFVALIAIIIQSLSIHSFGFGVVDYGEKTGDFILQNKLTGPYFNNFNVGGYLAYRIFPQRVFIDNRPEAYPANFLERIYTPLQTNPLLFNREDKKYHFNTLILSHWDNTPYENKLLRFLLQNPKYAPVYLDTYAIVFQKKSLKNAPFIVSHPITKRSIHIDRINNPQELVRYLFFFEKVGWADNIQKACIQLKKIDPNRYLLQQYPLEKTCK